MPQSLKRVQIVLLLKIFSRVADRADVVGGARIFYGVGGREFDAGVAWVYPVWEHRIFDGPPAVKG